MENDKSSFLYQKCYCEENIYKLAERIANKKDDRIVFISNDALKIPVFNSNGDATVWVPFKHNLNI